MFAESLEFTNHLRPFFLGVCLSLQLAESSDFLLLPCHRRKNESDVQYLPGIRDLVMIYKVTPVCPHPSPVLGGLPGREESTQDKSSPLSRLATPPQHSQSWKLSLRHILVSSVSSCPPGFNCPRDGTLLHDALTEHF